MDITIDDDIRQMVIVLYCIIGCSRKVASCGLILYSLRLCQLLVFAVVAVVVVVVVVGVVVVVYGRYSRPKEYYLQTHTHGEHFTFPELSTH